MFKKSVIYKFETATLVKESVESPKNCISK